MNAERNLPDECDSLDAASVHRPFSALGRTHKIDRHCSKSAHQAAQFCVERAGRGSLTASCHIRFDMSIIVFSPVPNRPIAVIS